MAWTYEEVMAKLGDEAQAVPGAIVVFRNKHIEVARVTIDGGFHVTEEGRKILEPEAVEDAEEAPKPKAPRAKKAVAPVEPELDALDL